MAGKDTVGGEDGHRIKHGKTGYSWGEDGHWIKHGRTGNSLEEDGHRIKHGKTGYSWGRGWALDKTRQDWIQLGERMDTA